MVAVIRISPYGPILVLLVALLAGCLVDSGQDRLQTMIERPDHEAGQFWTYSMEGDLGSREWAPGVPVDAQDGFTVVASAVDERGTLFATDICEMEYGRGLVPLFDNRSLQQEPGSKWLLDWPLKEGKTWTPGGGEGEPKQSRGSTIEDQSRPWMVRVEKIEAGVAHIVLVDGDGKPRYEANYDAKHGWFSYLHIIDAELRFHLESAGSLYSGSICDYTMSPLLSFPLEDDRETYAFEVPEGDALFVQWNRKASATHAGAAVFRLEYRPPQEEDYETLDEEMWYVAAGSRTTFRSMDHHLPSQPGEWELRVTSLTFTGKVQVDHIRFQQDPYPEPSG